MSGLAFVLTTDSGTVLGGDSMARWPTKSANI